MIDIIYFPPTRDFTSFIMVDKIFFVQFLWEKRYILDKDTYFMQEIFIHSSNRPCLIISGQEDLDMACMLYPDDINLRSACGNARREIETYKVREHFD